MVRIDVFTRKVGGQARKMFGISGKEFVQHLAERRATIRIRGGSIAGTKSGLDGLQDKERHISAGGGGLMAKFGFGGWGGLKW